jgi:hypothetical protein
MRPHLVRDGGILKRAVAPRAKPRGLHSVQNVAGERAGVSRTAGRRGKMHLAERTSALLEACESPG